MSFRLASCPLKKLVQTPKSSSTFQKLISLFRLLLRFGAEITYHDRICKQNETELSARLTQFYFTLLAANRE